MNQMISVEQSTQITLPLFQPLRFWTPRPVSVQTPVRPVNCTGSILSAKGFSMKGGFVHSTGGVRRMVIAGKIIKNESMVRV